MRLGAFRRVCACVCVFFFFHRSHLWEKEKTFRLSCLHSKSARDICYPHTHAEDTHKTKKRQTDNDDAEVEKRKIIQNKKKNKLERKRKNIPVFF